MLKGLFPRGRAKEIAEQTGLPLTAGQEAYSMGIKIREFHIWSVNEVKLIKKLYQCETAQSIADKLGISTNQVRYKASLIGIKKEGRTPARDWSRKDVTLLRKMYPNNSVPIITTNLDALSRWCKVKHGNWDLEKRILFIGLKEGQAC